MSQRVESSKDQKSLGVSEDASKQGRSIVDIDADVEVTLVYETQVRHNDDLIFDTGVLDDVEMPVEAKVDGKMKQYSKDKGKGIMIEPKVPLKRKRSNSSDEQIARDEDIAIDVIPLATKLPVIIDYKLHKEGMLVHYELIRADGNFNVILFNDKDATRNR
ncbi:hypothetical protein Tco_1406810 [Tanacetum coccineum]